MRASGWGDSARVPLRKHLRVLLALDVVASLLHFSHDAEFIALYPNMLA
ncbi:MAG TPA: hypothetical protein VFE82_08505 [Ramlibacter sp.]|jgi:hypothetical protein|nr:hypothetical protein [Ramlibacter sp.]HZY18509.1 hypothetical protein [Ramlibacter sp.]